MPFTKYSSPRPTIIEDSTVGYQRNTETSVRSGLAASVPAGRLVGVVAASLCWLSSFSTVAQPAAGPLMVRATDVGFGDSVSRTVDRMMGLDGYGWIARDHGCRRDRAESLAPVGTGTPVGTPVGTGNAVGSVGTERVIGASVAADLDRLEREILTAICQIYGLSPSLALQDPFFEASGPHASMGRWELPGAWASLVSGTAFLNAVETAAIQWQRWTDHQRAGWEPWLKGGLVVSWPATDVVRDPGSRRSTPAATVGHPSPAVHGLESGLFRPSGYRKLRSEELRRSAAPLSPIWEEPAARPLDGVPPGDSPGGASPRQGEPGQQVPLLPLERPLFWEVFSLRAWSWLGSPWAESSRAWAMTSQQAVASVVEHWAVGLEKVRNLSPIAAHSLADWWGRPSEYGANGGEILPEPTASYVGLENVLQRVFGSAHAGWTSVANHGLRLARTVALPDAGQKRSLSRLVLERFDAIHR